LSSLICLAFNEHIVVVVVVLIAHFALALTFAVVSLIDAEIVNAVNVDFDVGVAVAVNVKMLSTTVFFLMSFANVNVSTQSYIYVLIYSLNCPLSEFN